MSGGTPRLVQSASPFKNELPRYPQLRGTAVKSGGEIIGLYNVKMFLTHISV